MIEPAGIEVVVMANCWKAPLFQQSGILQEIKVSCQLPNSTVYLQRNRFEIGETGSNVAIGKMLK